jgi:hypothetical protein
MRYLKKSAHSQVISNQLQYPKDAKRIRDELLKEQIGFCAYSERYVQNTDAVDVEHFDARLKGTENDSYWNWYAVLSWMNKRKPRKIEPFEPILQPYSEDINRRIKYEDGQFLAVDPNDKEADNLIKYLGWNSPELYEDRRKHIDRIRFVQKACGDDQESFFNYLVNHPDNLSFFSTLRVELGLPETLIERVNKR